MAQRVQVLLEDDIDGSEATATVQFGLDGTTYEIDLSDKNSAALRKALAKFVEHGRKVSKGRPTTSGSKGKANTGGPKPDVVREWAKGHGFENLPERGRIPQEVQEAYDKAHAA